MVFDVLMFLGVTAAHVLYGLALPPLVRRLVAKDLTPESKELASSVGFRIAMIYSLIMGLMVAALVANFGEPLRL
jgi:hypothetical protein